MIKMSLGTEVGLGPGHTVLDGDPVGTQPLSGHAYCGQMVADLSNCGALVYNPMRCGMTVHIV